MLGSLILNKEIIVPKFLVLYRGGDAKGLSPKENDVLFKKWQKYMEKLAKSGALQDGGPVQSSAATQLVGKARSLSVGAKPARWRLASKPAGARRSSRARGAGGPDPRNVQLWPQCRQLRGRIQHPGG